VLTLNMSCVYDGPVRDLAGSLARESPLFTQVNNPYRLSGSSTTVRKTLTSVRVSFCLSVDAAPVLLGVGDAVSLEWAASSRLKLGRAGRPRTIAHLAPKPRQVHPNLHEHAGSHGPISLHADLRERR